MSPATSNRRAAFTPSCAPCPISSTLGRTPAPSSWAATKPPTDGQRRTGRLPRGDGAGGRRPHRLEPRPFSGPCTLFLLLQPHPDQPLPCLPDRALRALLVAAGGDVHGCHDRGLRRAPGAGGAGARQNRASGGFLRPRSACPAGGGRARQPRRPRRTRPRSAGHVVETYDFHTRALPTHVARINDLVAAKAGLSWAPLPSPRAGRPKNAGICP
jgi:hypothetical protein